MWKFSGFRVVSAFISFGIISTSAWAANICTDPVTSICQSDSARQASVIRHRVESEFRRLRIISRMDNWFGYCPRLAAQTGHVLSSCDTQVLKLMEKQVFTEALTRLVRTEFEEARRSVVNLLTQKLETVRDPQVKMTLKERLRVIYRAKLEFDLVAVAGKSSPIGTEGFDIWNTYTSPASETVFLAGMTVLARSHPRFIRWMLTHELGHLIGPTATTSIFGEQAGHSGVTIGFKPWSKMDLAFESEMNCLDSEHRPRSFAHRDTKCINENLVSALSKVGASTQRSFQIQQRLTLVSQSPIFSPVIVSESGELCQMDQGEEVFADWVAAMGRSEEIMTEADLIETMAPHCVDREILIEKNPFSHPDADYRIRFFAGQSAVQKTFGCSTRDDGKIWTCPLDPGEK
ncbi:MAG: hypothetical protein AB7F86_08530 [Bdellovibrionales bacterium]